MITSIVYLTVKPGRIDDFRKLATRAVTSTHAEDASCISYVCYQQHDNPHEFVVYEQWQDQAAGDAHAARLDQTIGFDVIFDACEKTQLFSYDVVA
jgi:quinol monooxygenase YgiN